jgi:hypothetical protein
MSSSAPPKRGTAPRSRFEPRFTLGLLYLFAFFFLYALLFVTPALIEAYRGLPPGPAQEDLELASRIAQQALRGKLRLAFAAAALSTAGGIWIGVLPGLRRR